MRSNYLGTRCDLSVAATDDLVHHGLKETGDVITVERHKPRICISTRNRMNENVSAIVLQTLEAVLELLELSRGRLLNLDDRQTQKLALLLELSTALKPLEEVLVHEL